MKEHEMGDYAQDLLTQSIEVGNRALRWESFNQEEAARLLRALDTTLVDTARRLEHIAAHPSQGGRHN